MRLDAEQVEAAWRAVRAQVGAVNVGMDEPEKSRIAADNIQRHWPLLMDDFRHTLIRWLPGAVRHGPVPDPILVAFDILTLYLADVVRNTYGEDAEFVMELRDDEGMRQHIMEHAALCARKTREN